MTANRSLFAQLLISFRQRLWLPSGRTESAYSVTPATQDTVRQVSLKQVSFTYPFFIYLWLLFTLTANVWPAEKSLYLDGSTYVDCGSHSSLDFANQITISCWVKPMGSSIPAEAMIVTRTNGSQTDWRFMAKVYANGNGEKWGFRPVPAGAEPAAQTTLSLNNWYHLAVTYDKNSTSDNIKFYLNGQPDGTADDTRPLTNGHPLKIGRGIGGAQAYFEGLVDDVAIWSSPLSASQISDIYSNGPVKDLTDGYSADLKGYWRFNETEWFSSVVLDSSGNSNNGAITGAATRSTSTVLLPPSGFGTEAAPYQIATLRHLSWISQNSSEWSKYFQQVADIDASATQYWDDSDDDSDGDKYNDSKDVNSSDSNQGFNPIGNSTTKFTGSYDGQDYLISHLTIDRASDRIGMFGWANNATIQNLGLTDVSIVGADYTGGLIGRNDDQSVVSNSYSTGSVTGTNAVGGLIGRNGESSEVNNSHSTSSVTGTNRVGGLVGSNYWSSEVNNSYSTSSVTGANKVGGLVGNNSSSSKVNNSYSTGAVTGTSNNVGGLIGQNDNQSTVNNSYSTGSVTGTSNVGGLVGNSSSSTITNSFWDTQTSGTSTGIGAGTTTGATGNTTAQMKTVTTFTDAGWDFEIETANGTDNYWDIDNAYGSYQSGYPFLGWQNGTTVLLVEPQILVVTGSISGDLVDSVTEVVVTNSDLSLSTVTGVEDGAYRAVLIDLSGQRPGGTVARSGDTIVVQLLDQNGVELKSASSVLGTTEIGAQLLELDLTVQSQPQLVVDSEIDLGLIYPGSAQSAQLTLSNSGSGSLSLDSISSSGGGLSLVGEMPTSIAVGGQVEVGLEFSTDSLGLISERVTIVSHTINIKNSLNITIF